MRSRSSPPSALRPRNGVRYGCKAVIPLRTKSGRLAYAENRTGLARSRNNGWLLRHVQQHTGAGGQSAGGQHAAALFQRDCGATTGFSTQVSVLTPGDEVTGGGNAFRADDDHGAAAVGEWHGSWADLRWLSSDHLLIRYAVRSRIFKRDDQAAGVRISYQEVAR